MYIPQFTKLKKYDRKNKTVIHEMVNEGFSVKAISAKTGVDKSTIYRTIENLKWNKPFGAFFSSVENPDRMEAVGAAPR